MKFQSAFREALPILIQAAERSDNTARAWALSGINFVITQAAHSPTGAVPGPCFVCNLMLQNEILLLVWLSIRKDSEAFHDANVAQW